MRIADLSTLVFNVLCGETKARETLKEWVKARRENLKEMTDGWLVPVLNDVNNTDVTEATLPEVADRFAAYLEKPPKSETLERAWYDDVITAWSGLLTLAAQTVPHTEAVSA